MDVGYYDGLEIELPGYSEALDSIPDGLDAIRNLLAVKAGDSSSSGGSQVSLLSDDQFSELMAAQASQNLVGLFQLGFTVLIFGAFCGFLFFRYFRA